MEEGNKEDGKWLIYLTIAALAALFVFSALFLKPDKCCSSSFSTSQEVKSQCAEGKCSTQPLSENSKTQE